ncbi:MAG TPA: sigma-70 family RNA polymerase sigma factor [Candidatus Acidoferrales bacterium]|nr:sigma-70 family RNA polymerase sigma factor [Candidatus Acidoferrales bacterium]
MSVNEMVAGQDQRIAHAVEVEQARLKNFIRRRVPDAQDVEDVLQDVFYELVEAYRMMKPIEHVSAWLYRVARNRITDLFRRKRPETSTNEAAVGHADDDETLRLEDLLPSPEAGPEAAYAREVLIEELDAALGELPAEQRQVFVAHEIEGRSFKDLAQETGLSVNALILRKHYAVRHLRDRLEAIHDEFQAR